MKRVETIQFCRVICAHETGVSDDRQREVAHVHPPRRIEEESYQWNCTVRSLSAAATNTWHNVGSVVNEWYNNADPHLVLHDHATEERDGQNMVQKHFPVVWRVTIHQDCVEKVPNVVAHWK